jgi:hypothetical protein
MRIRFSRLALTLGTVALVLGSAGPAPTAEPTRDQRHRDHRGRGR